MAFLSVALLPIILAFIMFSLGLMMRFDDIKYVAVKPKAFIVGFLAQLLLVPAMTFVLILVFKPAPAIAFGFMLLSFCPGGVSSNILCNLARGNLPLSVSLTSVMSLLAILLVPIATTFAYGYFLKDAANEINMLAMGLKMFLITAVPVALGIVINESMPGFSSSVRARFVQISTILFALLVVVAIVSNRQVLMEQFGRIGIMIIVLLVVLFSLGLLLSKLFGLSWFDAKAIGVEVGIQNSAMAIALAGLIAVNHDTVLPEFALPAAVYGVLMFVVAIPYIALVRNLGVEEEEYEYEYEEEYEEMA